MYSSWRDATGSSIQSCLHPVFGKGRGICHGIAIPQALRNGTIIRRVRARARERSSRKEEPGVTEAAAWRLPGIEGAYFEGAGQPRANMWGEGHNLVGVLKYKSPQKPSREVFEARKWFLRTHHSYENSRILSWCSAVDFKGHGAKMLERVDHVTLLREDPKDAKSYRGWNFGDDVMWQVEWDRGIRD